MSLHNSRLTQEAIWGARSIAKQEGYTRSFHTIVAEVVERMPVSNRERDEIFSDAMRMLAR